MISCHLFVEHVYIYRLLCYKNLNLCSLKQYIIKSIDLTKLTPNKIIIDTEPKLSIGLGSHKKPVRTPEPENSSCG